jgi:hypothetical protein
MVSNFKVINDEQTTQIRVHEAIESYEQTFDERIVSEVVPPPRKVRHLDVDAVLTRSLPMVTEKDRNSDQEKDRTRI